MNEQVIWSPGMTLEAMEKQIIKKAFTHYRGNKTATANALGIAIRTLDYKFERYLEEETQQKEREEYDKRKREEFLARCRGIQQEPVGTKSFEADTFNRTVSLPESETVRHMLPQQTTNLRSKKTG